LIDTNKLTNFKDQNINIYLKIMPTGSYDIQLIWKYYFPKKFLDWIANEFYYQLMIDSSQNSGVFMVY